MTASALHFLPYGRQSVGEDDVAAVVAALKGDFLTTGPRVDEFERAFAQATGATYAVACNSGTAALHLAVLTLDLQPGDAVVVPTMTFLATANVVRMAGAEVVFADVDADTGLITPATLAEACDRARAGGLRVRGAIPVHLNGNLADMAALATVVPEADFAFIEDACHALGETDIGATRHSRLACFSTHPVKAIATGEGGVVTTADASTAKRLKRLRSHGMIHQAEDFQNNALALDNGVPNSWYYEMQEIGWNYRMPDVLCALGINQLRKLPDFYRRRREIAALYDELLAPLAPQLRPVPRSRAGHGWHLYALLIEFAEIGMTRAQFMAALRKEGIGTQVHYIPVHRQPYYACRYGDTRLPGADAYYARCLSVPLFPAMADEDARRVVAELMRLLKP